MKQKPHLLAAFALFDKKVTIDLLTDAVRADIIMVEKQERRKTNESMVWGARSAAAAR